jgi:cysteine desulfurase/selenocysteine lyase
MIDTPALGDRSLFPDLNPRAYLNHAAIAPPSVPVRRAVNKALTDYARDGLGAIMEWIEQRSILREDLAQLIGAASDDIGYIGNTTQGVVDIALCFPWRKGDRIILFEDEFPTNVTPWLNAAKAHDLEVVFLPSKDYQLNGAYGLQRLEDTLKSGCRLMAVSAVAFQTGLRMPLAAMSALCHRYDAEIFVDGIQSCGAVPMDMRTLELDYLACGGHKWLMGMEGTGFLYIRPDKIGKLRPLVAGWLSHEDGLDFLFEGPGLLRYDKPIRKRADFIEGGVSNVLGLAALGASVKLLLTLGTEAIYEHVNSYLDTLEGGLLERGFQSLRAPTRQGRSCILSVLPPNPGELKSLLKHLHNHGIMCTMPDGHLRFSPHWPNGSHEIAEILETVDSFQA